MGLLWRRAGCHSDTKTGHRPCPADEGLTGQRWGIWRLHPRLREGKEPSPGRSWQERPRATSPTCRLPRDLQPAGPLVKNVKDGEGRKAVWERCPPASESAGSWAPTPFAVRSLRGTRGCHSLTPSHTCPEASLKGPWPGASWDRLSTRVRACEGAKTQKSSEDGVP